MEVTGSFNGWHHQIKLDPQPSSSIIDQVGSRSYIIFVSKMALNFYLLIHLCCAQSTFIIPEEFILMSLANYCRSLLSLRSFCILSL